MASVMGTTPRDLLMQANSNDPAAAMSQWQYHEQNRMTGDEYVITAARANAPVTYQNTSSFLRLPPPGQAAVVVAHDHAVAIARSESGHHAAVVDPQARQHHVFSVRRVPDAQADQVQHHVFMHGPSRKRDNAPKR